jgi:MFS family permease
MAGAQWAMAAVAGLLAVLAAVGMISLAVLAVAVVAQGLLVGLNQPARLAFVPSLVPDALLPTALALNSTAFNASRFVGPALAGLLLAAFGPAPVFLVNALSYIAFLATLRGLPGGSGNAGPAAARTAGGLGAEMVEGARVVLAAGPLRDLFLILAASAVLVRPMGELLPAFAGGVLSRGPETLGLLSAAVGLGAGLAGFALAHRPDRDQDLAFRRGTLGAAAAVVLLALSPSFALALPAAALAGVALATAGVSAQTLAQRAAPDRLRGRVMSLYGVVLRSVPAAGGLAIGLLAEVVGLRWALAAGAIAFAAAWPFLATRSHRAAPAVDSGPARS